MNARQRLNACKKKGRTAAEWQLIKLLREAIKESETSLHAKGYTDHVEDTENFINDHLKALHEALV